MNEEKNKNSKVVKKVKKRKLKIGYILAFILIVLAAIFIIKLVLPSSTSKYGNRLDGIEKIKFGSEEQKAIIDRIKQDERANNPDVTVKGKIIYNTFNINNDANKDDAKWIAGETLGVISDEVKNFYDINYTITKKDEEGQKVTKTKDDGTEEEITVTEFPIMGYKNSNRGDIVW